MHIATQRPNRRPKLYLPLFLSPAAAGTSGAGTASFPLSSEQLRRAVAEMIG